MLLRGGLIPAAVSFPCLAMVCFLMKFVGELVELENGVLGSLLVGKADQFVLFLLWLVAGGLHRNRGRG